MAVAARLAAPRRGGLLERVALYGASRGITEGLLALRGLVLAGLLGPAGFGAWSLFRLGSRYATFGNLGVMRGLEFELVPAGGGDAPAALAAERERERAAGTALGFVLVLFTLLGAGMVAASFALDDPLHRLTLRALGAAALVEELYLYGLVCLRVRGALRRYATVEMTHAALQVTLASLLALRWGLGGACVGLVLATAVAAALTARWAAVRPRIDRAALRRLLAVGLPLMLTTALGVALSTGDRWVVAGLGGNVLLGQYSFAAAVAGLAGTVGWVIRTVVFRDVYRGARAGDAAGALRAHLDRVVRPYAVLYPIVLGAAAMLVGPALALVVPRHLPAAYLAAVAPAQVFLLIGVANGLTSLGGIGVVAAGRQRALPMVTAAALALNVAVSAVALEAHAGLVVVAAGAFTGATIVAGAILLLSLRAAGGAHPARGLAALLAPLLWCAAVTVALGALFPGHDLRSTLAALACYLAAMLPLAGAARRELAKVR